MIAACLLVGTVALASAAHAAPTAVGVEKAAYVDAYLVDANGAAFDLIVAASHPEASTSRASLLRVTVSSRSSTADWTEQIPASALSLTASGATLHTLLAGHRLDVTWNVVHGSIYAGGGRDIALGSSLLDDYTMTGTSATAHITLDRLACTTDWGAVGNLVAVATGSAASSTLGSVVTSPSESPHSLPFSPSSVHCAKDPSEIHA